MSKRPVDDGSAAGPSGQPPPKKVQFEPLRIGPISTLEELDIKTLQFQNKKLAQRLEQRHKLELDLRGRIEQLEKRQTQDDAVLNVINRYWNQLNEDIRVLLQRFDAETADETESKNENEATTSFLTQLASWDKEELDEKLANRVQVSQRAVGKILQAFDRLLQRNEKVTAALKGEQVEEGPSLDEAVKQANVQLQSENCSLHSLNTSLHEKHHTLSLKVAEIQEKLTAKETENAELQNKMDELEYDLQKTQQRSEKFEGHLADAMERLKMYQPIEEEDQMQSTGKGKTSMMFSISQKKLDDLQKELEEYKELSSNRLQELEKLHQDHKEVLKEVEKLKMDICQLPESVIVETTEYKCLQSQFSVLYNESMQLKTQLEETRNHLTNSKNTHLRQIEQMESEELLAQKKLRTEVIQLEDMLAQVRKEYEMLRIEFEQNLAANEQTGPINREMRHLITSLQNHNQQLKGEAYRYKRKLKEINTEILRLKCQLEEMQSKQQTVNDHSREQERTSSESGSKDEGDTSPHPPSQVKEEPGITGFKKEPDSDTELDDLDKDSDSRQPTSTVKKEVKKEKDTKKEVKTEKEHRDKEAHRMKEAKISESEALRDLKAQMKKGLNDQKEMKLLLDMYKGVGKEQRDKVQLMAAERKARADLDEMRKELKKLQESKREERKKLADDDAMRKIRQLEDQVHSLQKQVAAQKQEEEAVLNEMEVTGQAFEDMQEQNSRLIQQLREKDDANFKLMSERIKSNQIHKLAREEKQMLIEQVNTLSTQVEAQNQVVRKLEEKERILQNSLATEEKELGLRQQAMEMHKRKAIESAQSAADLKLHLEKYHAQMKEAQQVVAEKTSSLEAEAYKTKRLQEEIAQQRRKLERLKKIEIVGTADEVKEEEIREYKETLTCPSCKVKRKDAVLTKCFHVFCFNCLRTRYETRQRKCPKCNAAFGANDYHRLYLS